MAVRTLALVVALAAYASASALSQQREQNAAEAESSANPIRRVVTMLQNMAKKIAAESEKEKELYDKYMCYCKSAGGTLQAGIDAADNKIPQVESAIKEAEESKVQLEQDVKDHQSARADAKKSMAEATAIREKEAAEFAKEKAEYDTNIGQLSGAIDAIEKGMTGFVQTKAAAMVRRLAVNSADLSNFDRQMLMSFLSGESNQGYAPKSGDIVGILKQMKDTMVKDLADVTATEKAAITTYDELMAAKTKEVEAATKAIESKTKRIGELGVSIAEMKNDLDDTSAALLEDKKFLADMDETCEAKKKQWGEIVKARAEETVAIQETIKILNDDDALELFKKTLPSPSFVQTGVNTEKMKRKALALLKQLRDQPNTHRPHLDMISLALTGRKVSFEKVIKMIDNMVSILGKEQVDDDAKKEYCEKQLDAGDDKKKGLQQDLKDLETSIEDTKETLATLTDEIKQLTKGIEALDKEVAESTETRKEEHADYSELMSSDAAAKELLGIAKNRLNKYYNPKLYKPPPKRELSEEERIVTNMGGTLAPTAAPGGIAGTGVTAFQEVNVHSNVAPPPPPESFKAYSKKGEESTGVIAMIDLLIGDLDKEMTEAETAEKSAQKEYEAFMSDAAEKRAMDSKSVTDKEGYKADAESELSTAKEGQAAKVKELMATEKYVSSLHAECDWLMANYEIRKEARAGEVESLKNAKAVLAGADFSLLQKKDMARSLRGIQH
jgi:peptidoglycan hydrolase CwlO-like protein